MLNGSLIGPVSEADAGNGAAMRNLPVVLATLHNDEAFRQQTLDESRFTHNHPLSDAATLALGDMTRTMLNGGGVMECREIANALILAYPKFQFNPYPKRASGYILDTMQTVLHTFFSTDSFESLVVETVNYGEDADTTGAIAGMLGGARYGASAIPKRWVNKLDPKVVSEILFQVGGLLRLSGK
jgi:ADP-ribosyl-[dinitrogen reductase] hydrolase